jgi:C1A family cysteine protease
MSFIIPEHKKYPESLDWCELGACSPVKDQGQCGSCWAFSTTGSIEGAYYLKNKELVSFSEQQLVDCSTENAGCNGGLMDYAFDWVENNALCSETDYPYMAQDSFCKGTCKGVTKISSFVDVLPNFEPALLSAIAITPVSVAIEADQSVFQFYRSGVISTKSCGTNLDHGVLLTGYGTDLTTGLDYWKVKNSWGSGWGDNGFVLLQRNMNATLGQKGTCGISAMASYPVL